MNVKLNNVNLQLTDDPLENIKIMAPLLGKREQENVFYFVMGLYNGVNKQNEPDQKGA